MNSVSRVVRRVAYMVWRRRIRTSLDRTDSTTMFGLHLVIPPGVLHPKHFASSRILGEHLMTLDLMGLKVADLGTGSGLLGLLAARKGALVTAIDINPASVLCAGENARRNGLSERVDSIVSDGFDALPASQRFDLVVTNPPFYPRNPKSLGDRAFAAGADYSFFRSLAQGLDLRLSEKGSALLIHSSDAPFEACSLMFAAGSFVEHSVLERRGLFETLKVKEYKRAPPTLSERSQERAGALR